MEPQTGKILIVEDEQIIAFNLAGRLKRLGYQVPEYVSNGEDAVRKAVELQPDLILMDIMLDGEMDGIEAASRIHELTGIPHFFLTASSDDETVERAKHTQPLGYLIKPFDENVLRISIEMALYKQQAQNLIRAKEQRYQTTLDSIVAGVITVDLDGRIKYQNPASKEYFSFTEGDSFSDQVQFYIDGNTITGKELLAQAVNSGAAVELGIDCWMKTAQGMIPVDGTLSLIEIGGSYDGAVFSFRNITDLKLAEDRLARINGCFLDFTPNPDENITKLTELACHLTGGSCGFYFRLRGPELQEVCRWSDNHKCPILKSLLPKFLQDQYRQLKQDKTLELVDGALEGLLTDPVNVKLQLHYIGHGDTDEPGGILVVVIDRQQFRFEKSLNNLGMITAAIEIEEERRQAEENRRMLQTQLIQSQKLESIGTMAGGVAHEINNPLMGIINYAQLIKDRLPDDMEMLREFTSEIIGEGERIAKIVRNLLAFSRQEKEDFSPVIIKDAIENAVGLVGRLLEKHEVILKLNIPDNLPRVWGRQQQLEQVLVNLLNNGKDALDEKYNGYNKNKILSVSAEQIHTSGDFVRIKVTDYGNGIPEEIRDKLFDPFFSTKPKHRGTGLGLAVSYGIIQEHKGQMMFLTEPGKQTVFSFDVPVYTG